MRIQKTTVLDVARVCEELRRYKSARIESTYAGASGRILYLKLHDDIQVLKCSIGPDVSYIGTIQDLPERCKKALPGTEDCRIGDIEQINNDRIIEMQLEKKDRLGKSTALKLIFELIPNTGDVYFTDSDFNIKSTLRRKRKKRYQYPDQLKKPTVLNITMEQLGIILKNKVDLTSEIYGLNTRDIINLSLSENSDADELFYDFSEYIREAAKPGPAWIIVQDNEYVGYSLVKPVIAPDETAIEFDSAILMYERYYTEVSGAIDDNERIDNLRKAVKAGISKIQKRISKIEKELEEYEKAALYKMYGEMILSNMGQIRKGAASVSLDSTFDESSEKMTIKLDPAKTPSANAEAYFKKAKKAAGSRSVLEGRLAESNQELAELEGILGLIENDQGAAEKRLIEAGLIVDPESRISSKKAVEPRKPYRRFIASCGWEILVGKSNKDNDELTFHIASKEDYWFHAWQGAGSHTVLRLPDRSSKPDKQTLLEAASLAAWYSKAKHSSKVPVLYTLVKYVRKPRKFR